MFRRTVRIACLVVGLLVTAGILFRAVQDDNALSKARQDSTAADTAISRTSELLIDIRASMHAYVAPGQSLPFWAKQAQENINVLRQNLVTLDAMVAANGGSLAESLDSMDQLTAAESRARTYVSRGEMQLAGDVIFTDVRDLLAAATNQIGTTRTALKRRNEQRQASIRSEQTLLVATALGLWIAIAMFLLPTPATVALKDPAQWRSELKETLQKSIPVTPESLVPVAPAAPVAPAEPAVSLASMRALTEICADLSSLTDPGALHGALERVSAMLNATGLIVWVASNDGASLSPVATHGFDPNLVARIGKISRDSANLTAAAFRENTPKISAPTALAPAALAIAMCGPTGPAGVLSVELKPGQSVDEPKIALASVIAAQLATLAMPIVETEAIENLKTAAL
ncbi:MAG: hypothetical protein ABI983_00805 [Acidobacteriota bacterium]